MRDLKRFEKHYTEVLAYDLSFADWLASQNTSMANVTITTPSGLNVVDSEAFGVVHLVISGGTPQQAYRVIVLCNAANGLKKRSSIMVLITGDVAMSDTGGGVDPGTPTDGVVTLITGTTIAAGAGVARVKSNWSYEVDVVSDTPSATATIKVRVGNTIACPNTFDDVSVVCSASPGTDGKYHGVGVTFGTLFWPYHAADITAISGTNTNVTVTGSSS